MKVDIKIPAMKARVIMYFGSYEEIKSILPKGIESFNEYDAYLARTMLTRSDGKYPFTVLIHSKSRAISVVAHEAVHATSFILDSMGVQADFNNDEVQAYLVQYICEQAESKLNTYGGQHG